MRVYRQRLLALDDAELEHFARDWVALQKNLYFEVKSYAGPQDLGRDVVGFLTKQRHEGPWHNYQCKQYTRRRLPLGNGLAELGKILYHAHTGAFTPPAAYHFVAPYGISRDLEGLIDKPQSLRRALIGGWDTYCRKSIIQGKAIPLDAALRAVIEAYDFSLVTHIALADMLAADGVLLVLHRHLGTDPGPAPKTPAPDDVQEKELGYIAELLGAYGARDGTAYSGHEDIARHADHGEHFRRQRERFFDADGFKHFYRDNTAKETLPALEDEIHYGIIETRNLHYPDALHRHDAVMQEAGKLVLSAPLGPHARVTVKQGYCHHLVNDGKMTWQKK